MSHQFDNKIKKLVIGKNSNIVREIQSELKDCIFISHTEIDNVNFETYAKIFIFSWSHKNIAENIDLLSKVPLEKSVFVSTVSVYSNLIRKQWADYPNNKRICEKIVYKNGGSILRIGAWSDDYEKKTYGFFFRTKKDKLIHELNNWKDNEKRVHNIYELSEGKLSKFKAFIGVNLRRLSLVLPSKFIFQAPFVIFGRLLGILNYGYSGDTIACCSKKLLVGYGAFGGFYFKHNRKEIDKVIVSGSRELNFNYNRFNRTLVGKEIYGLSSKWHGVYLVKIQKDFKKFILASKRNKKLSKEIRICGDVQSLAYDGRYIRCEVTDEDENIHSYYGQKFNNSYPPYELLAYNVILSAGPIENARLLNTLEDFPVRFDDHELSLLGEIKLSNELGKYIYCWGPFIFYKSSLVTSIDNHELLIDFRPYVNSKLSKNIGFYNENTSNIVIKIFSNLSFSRFNEAFFNRFGIAFKTTLLHVYAQVLVRDAILFSRISGLKRTRLNDAQWANIKFHVISLFKSFKIYSENLSIDSLHIWSSETMTNSKMIMSLIKSQKLKIFGSPCDSLTMTCIHHTHKFRVKLNEIQRQ
jgi:hypothetical protein